MFINCFLFILFIFSSSAVGPQSNTRGVSESLSTTCANSTAEMRSIINELAFNQTLTDAVALNYALSTLAPIVDGAVVFEAFENHHTIFNQFEKHLIQKSTTGIASGDVYMTPAGTWFSVYGQHANQRTRDNVVGYKNEAKGLVVGQDWSISNNLMIGVGLSWSDLDTDHLITNSANTDMTSYGAFIYGHYDITGNLFADVILGAAYNSYYTHRQVIFGNLRFFPDAKYYALQQSMQFDLGYDFLFDYILDDIHVIPVIQLFYSNLNFQSYTETGAGNINQTVDGQEFDMLLGGLGLQIARDFKCNDFIIQPEVHAKAFYDFFDNRMQTTSNFLGTFAPAFNTSGPRPPRDSYNFGASISTPIYAPGLALTVNYDYFVKQDYHSYNGFLKLRYQW